MRNLNLIDETFDEHFTDMYHIAIESDLKTLTYCLLDTRVNKYVMLKNFEIGDYAAPILLEKIEAIIEKEELFSKKFKSASFTFKSPKNTLVPSEFFKKDQVKTLYEFQNFIDELDELHFYNIEKLNATLIYTIPSRIAEILKRRIPKMTFLHENIVLLNDFLKMGKDADICLSFTAEYFNVAIVSNGQVQLFNSFAYKAATDVIFFLLGVAGQKGLKPDTLRISVFGSIEKNSELAGQIKNFFRNIRYEKATSEFEYSYKLKEVDSHIYANLFNSYTCVS